MPQDQAIEGQAAPAAANDTQSTPQSNLSPMEQAHAKTYALLDGQPEEKQQAAPTPQGPASIDIPGIGKVPVDEVLKWKNGHMMDRDYRQKTQAAAERQRQMDAQEQEMQQKAHQLYAYAHTLGLISQAKQAQQSQAQQIPTEDDGDPYLDKKTFGQKWQTVEERLKKLDELEQWKAQQEQMAQRFRQDREVEQWEAKIGAELNAVREKFPFMLDNEVLTATQFNPQMSFEEAARISHERQEKFAKDYVQKNILTGQQHQQSPPASGTAPGFKVKPPSSMEEAHKYMSTMIDEAWANQ